MVVNFHATIQAVGDLAKLEVALLNNHRATTTPCYSFKAPYGENGLTRTIAK